MFNVLTLSMDWGNWKEWIGLIASFFVLISFLFNKILIVRLFSITGCVFFVTYAWFIDSLSVFVMNSALVCVHLFFLGKYYYDYRKKKKAAVSEEKSNS